MMQSRTHNCGELRLSDAGKSVTIVGWLENLREVGANFALPASCGTMHGTTQVVIENRGNDGPGQGHQQGVHHAGCHRHRPGAGEQEPQAAHRRDRGRAQRRSRCWASCRHNELPFEINKSKDADENARLKVPLSWTCATPQVKGNIVLRCQVVAALRRADDRAGLFGNHHPHPHRLLP